MKIFSSSHIFLFCFLIKLKRVRPQNQILDMHDTGIGHS